MSEIISRNPKADPDRERRALEIAKAILADKAKYEGLVGRKFHPKDPAKRDDVWLIHCFVARLPLSSGGVKPVFQVYRTSKKPMVNFVVCEEFLSAHDEIPPEQPSAEKEPQTPDSAPAQPP